MWETKTFETAAALASWTTANNHRYQIVEIAICNGWAVDFKPLRIIG